VRANGEGGCEPMVKAGARPIVEPGCEPDAKPRQMVFRKE